MSREFMANVVVPIIGGVILYLLQKLLKAYAKRVEAAADSDKARARAERIRAFSDVVEGAVSDMEQTVVRDLKDPTKKGTWDEVARGAVKVAAIDAAKRATPQLVAQLREDGSDVDQLASGFVERSLIKMRGGAPKVNVDVSPPATVAVDAATGSVAVTAHGTAAPAVPEPSELIASEPPASAPPLEEK